MHASPVQCGRQIVQVENRFCIFALRTCHPSRQHCLRFAMWGQLKPTFWRLFALGGTNSTLDITRPLGWNPHHSFG